MEKFLIIVALVFGAVVINGQPVSQCDTEKQTFCQAKGLAANTSQTFTFTNDRKYFVTCQTNENDANIVYAHACLKCQYQNEEYVERCDQCVNPVHANDCVKAKPEDIKPIDCSQLDDTYDTCRKENGSMALKYNKSKFYQCSLGVRSDFCLDCHPGMEFSELCEQCVYNTTALEEDNCGKSNATVADIGCDASLCHNRTAGGYELTQSSNEYYTCDMSGNCRKANCPEGLVYSGVCDLCEYKYIETGDQCQKNIVEEPQAAPLSCPANYCDDKATGYHSEGTDDGMYYYCNPSIDFGFATVKKCDPMKCPGGLVYNTDVQECQYKTS